jgi:hypothetical protein
MLRLLAAAYNMVLPLCILHTIQEHSLVRRWLHCTAAIMYLLVPPGDNSEMILKKHKKAKEKES